jgi:hypothetical protein
MSVSSLIHPPFFNRYISLVEKGDIKHLLTSSLVDLQNDLSSLSNVDLNYRYQEGKWDISTLLRHAIDAELIFSFRALSIVRNTTSTITSFDENDYAKASEYTYTFEKLRDEFINARKGSILLFNSFNEEWLQRMGTTDMGDQISVTSIGYILIGHWLHHKEVLQKNYGINM